MKYPYKHHDSIGQEDTDINNDVIDKKRDLYKRYLVAKRKNKHTSINIWSRI